MLKMLRDNGRFRTIYNGIASVSSRFSREFGFSVTVIINNNFGMISVLNISYYYRKTSRR